MKNFRSDVRALAALNNLSHEYVLLPIYTLEILGLKTIHLSFSLVRLGSDYNWKTYTTFPNSEIDLDALFEQRGSENCSCSLRFYFTPALLQCYKHANSSIYVNPKKKLPCIDMMPQFNWPIQESKQRSTTENWNFPMGYFRSYVALRLLTLRLQKIT